MLKNMEKEQKLSSNQNDQSTCSEQITHGQFIFQLIKHNDIQTLKELGIRTKDMNYLETFNDQDIDLDTQITPLILAVYLSRIDIIKMLINNPLIDLDQSSEDMGYTPVALACITGNFEVLSILLENGAEVNKPIASYQTPFVCCFQRLEEEQNTFENRKICLKMAELCLQYGADIDWIVDKVKGYTLLMQYTSIKMELSDQEIFINYEIIRFLLENGANKNLKNMKGKNLVELARKHPNKENIQNLIRNSQQIYFYNQKPDFNKNNQSKDINVKQKGSKSMMQYLAFCKN